MTIQQVSDQQLSKWIRNKLHPWDESRCRICGWPLKPTIEEGCTQESCSQRPAPINRADEAANYVNDPAMTVLLLEKMPVHYSLIRGVSGDWFVNKHLSGNQTEYVSGVPKLGRAVAEAWAKTHGWTE